MTVATDARKRLICALDTADPSTAARLAGGLATAIGGLKLGLEFFAAHGPGSVTAVARAQPGLSLFLDLKLHDIPNTVASAVRALLPLRPGFLTLHCSGGPAMLRAAVEAAGELPPAERPRLLGVTVLTSLDDEDLAAVGQGNSVPDQVRRLAALARISGLDGVVCAPNEVAALRSECGPGFVLMVPGIRDGEVLGDDQKRTMSAAEAIAAGASHIVVGRPITRAEDPVAAARRIAGQIAAVPAPPAAA